MSLFTRFQRAELDRYHDLGQSLAEQLDQQLSGPTLQQAFVNAARPHDSELARLAAKMPTDADELERFLAEQPYFGFRPAAANLLRLLSAAVSAVDASALEEVAARLAGNLDILRAVGHLDDDDFVDEPTDDEE